MNYQELAAEARKAQTSSISPYSKFRVGAALLTADGKVYTGSNIEISNYSLTICAERNAIFTALHKGERNFTAIAVACDTDGFGPPCGSCRQVLMDFCGGDLDFIMMNSKNDLKIVKLDKLLPYSFNKDYL